MFETLQSLTFTWPFNWMSSSLEEQSQMGLVFIQGMAWDSFAKTMQTKSESLAVINIKQRQWEYGGGFKAEN